MMAAWAERQLAQPSALEVIGPQCARLLSALVTGKLPHLPLYELDMVVLSSLTWHVSRCDVRCHQNC